MPARLKLSSRGDRHRLRGDWLWAGRRFFCGKLSVAYHTIVVKAISDLRVFALLVAMACHHGPGGIAVLDRRAGAVVPLRGEFYPVTRRQL